MAILLSFSVLGLRLLWVLIGMESKLVAKKEDGIRPNHTRSQDGPPDGMATIRRASPNQLPAVTSQKLQGTQTHGLAQRIDLTLSIKRLGILQRQNPAKA